MTMRIDERATEFEEIDRFEGGVGWIAHPEETMERASHAVVADGEVWVLDPVDAAGLDDLLAEFGPVAGVVVMLDRHKRDAAAVANRHDVPVYLPTWFDGVADGLEAPIVRFSETLAGTGFEAHVLKDSRFWQEVCLYDRERGTLVVPESVGTASYFRAGNEPLGVHPMRRLFPPTAELGSFTPDRILVGHGRGVLEDASRTLSRTLSTSRRGLPRAYAGACRQLLPF